jgi:hypothetical protein
VLVGPLQGQVRDRASLRILPGGAFCVFWDGYSALWYMTGGCIGWERSDQRIVAKGFVRAPGRGGSRDGIWKRRWVIQHTGAQRRLLVIAISRHELGRLSCQCATCIMKLTVQTLEPPATAQSIEPARQNTEQSPERTPGKSGKKSRSR